MGTAQSQGNLCGSLYIETLHSFFHAGGTVEGTVHLYLAQPVHAQELVLKFKTKEKWIFNHMSHRSYEQFKTAVIRPQ